MNLTKLSWPLGWTPSADAKNGDSNGLLRADNLQQEENGSIGLVRNSTAITTAADAIVNIHTRSLQGVDYLWYGLAGGRAVREITEAGGTRYGGDIISSGGTRPVITDIFGWVYALSGNQRKKFNGSQVFELGLDTPAKAPTIEASSQSTSDLLTAQENGGWVLDEGHDPVIDDHGIDAHADTTTLRSSTHFTYTDKYNILKIGGSGQSTSPENDTFLFSLQLGDSNAFKTVRVEFILDEDATNYYWYEWDLTASTQIRPGVDEWSTLKSTRGKFNRQGNDLTLGWDTLKTVRFSIIALTDVHFQFRDPVFVGGELGQLYGAYQYCYIYAKSNGQYVSKGPASPISETVEVLNGAVFIQTIGPDDNSEFPECWIFRRSVPSTAQYYDSLQGTFTQLPDLLDQFYLVLKADPGVDTVDTMSDNDAIEQNITLNQFLLAAKNIPGTIVDVLGPYFERVLYLTQDSLYLSERLNPEAVDTRYTLKIASAAIDNNLWLKKVNNTTLIIGATQDVYQLSGTLEDLPDGTLDVILRPLGEKYPPICYDVASVEGMLFYVGTNGIRTTNGTSSQLLSPQLSLLFQKLDRHGIPAINVTSGAVQSYPIAVAHNKLFVGLPFTDGVRRLVVYDFLAQTYQLRLDPVTALCSTESDNIILGIGSALVSAEKGKTFTNDTPRNIVLQTVGDSNGEPRNRKETFTLKLVGDTGGNDLDVEIGVDDSDFVNIGKFNSTGIRTRFFDLSALPLGFRYSLRISGAVLTFKLIEYTLEYQPFPEQLNYFHIQQTNLGTTARKRIGQYAFVINTLGHLVRFTPEVDGVALTSKAVTFSTTEKTTHIFQFLIETIGTDVGGYLESVDPTQPFEFWEPSLDKSAYETLPAGYDYILISPNNYETPNRKAFTSIKFGLDTHGATVRFTPILDGVSFPSKDFTTTANRPTTCEYFFRTSDFDVTAIDIGAELKYVTTPQGLGFEFYGPLHLQNLEAFPARLKTLYIRETNFEIAAKKRLRTLPIVINTNGADVTFTPYLDGVASAASVINGPRKKTLFHYFKSDAFLIDLAGFLSSDTPFEFYNIGKPEEVEILPVGKKYDQLGPIRIDKIGKLFRLRFRIIATGSSLPLTIYDDTSDNIPSYGNVVWNTDLVTLPNVDHIYELDLPKNINGGVFRFVLGPTDDVFHRYDCLVELAPSGMETDKKWVPIENAGN